MPPKSKSKYADYFQIRGNKATCNKCSKVLTMKDGNTSSLAYHCDKVCHIKIQQPKPNTEIQRQQQSTLDGFVKVQKPSKEELLSREAAHGVSFRYLAKSRLIKKGLASFGYNAPRNHTTVRTYVKKSANKHRQKLCDILKIHIKNGQRFCALTDEWTCSVKKRKYLNVHLHLKGKFEFEFKEIKILFVSKLQEIYQKSHKNKNIIKIEI